MRYEHMNEQELRNLAKTRVEAKKDFRYHSLTYVVVNLTLIAIYMLTTFGGYPWFLWVFSGWGVGLLMHYINLRTLLRSHTSDELQNEIQQMKR